MTTTALRTATAVFGGDGLLASRVIDRLADRAVAVRAVDPGAPEPELAASLDGVASVVVLGRGGGPDLDGTGGSVLDLGAVRRLLTASHAAAVPSLVVVSSAMVYGAHADNAVPLTEDAPARPDPDLRYGLQCAELERLVAGFARTAPGCRVTVLRPVVVLDASSTSWLRASAWGRRGLVAGEVVAPRQFVHVDDVVSAIEVACTARGEGIYNVAPDGWIAGDTFRELAGAANLPLLGTRPGTAIRRSMPGRAVAPGVASYTAEPWVVANDRLRGAGWVATHTSEEAFVEADRARGWRALSPRARQELSLVVVGATVMSAAVAAMALVARRRSRG
jgi:nucleoside-diphosphate-sugar epimerase